MPIWEYNPTMPRASTTSDAFNAVAEPRRRDILSFLVSQERAVNDIVSTLNLPQPSVSKHLRVLLEVGLVEVRREGPQKFYPPHAHPTKPPPEMTRPLV